MGVIPSPPPDADELAERIKKLATYVARNGADFESKVREKEALNPLFAFLRDEHGEANRYYQWVLFCAQQGYSAEQVQRLQESHCLRLQSHMGSIELTPVDAAHLNSLLRGNNGSKDAIKLVRKWVVKYAHSIVSIGLTLSAYVLSADFAQLLHTLYVLNDLFYNAKGASAVGPYTLLLGQEQGGTVEVIKLLLPLLPAMLCACSEAEEAQREKVLRLVRLWREKGFLDAPAAAALLAAAAGDTEQQQMMHQLSLQIQQQQQDMQKQQIHQQQIQQQMQQGMQ
ncbi:hypothetical protein B484DRAFT_401470, partial [Ochromonadaceae sp. CCMP2298]